MGRCKGTPGDGGLHPGKRQRGCARPVGRAEEALAKVRAFAEQRADEQGLVLLGDVGVGKTTLLLALVRSLAEQWVTQRKVVRLAMVPDFLRELRAGYDATQQKQGGSYSQLMGRYQACDVLVFDDLGVEQLTDWVEEQFYLLIDYQYRQRLPVLASSNCRKEALAHLQRRAAIVQQRAADLTFWQEEEQRQPTPQHTLS